MATSGSTTTSRRGTPEGQGQFGGKKSEGNGERGDLGPCCYTVISGCACAYACKTRCRPLPWRMVYGAVPRCGATTDKRRSRSCRCCHTPLIGGARCRRCTRTCNRRSRTSLGE